MCHTKQIHDPHPPLPIPCYIDRDKRGMDCMLGEIEGSIILMLNSLTLIPTVVSRVVGHYCLVLNRFGYNNLDGSRTDLREYLFPPIH